MNILFFYRIYPNYGGVEVVTTVLANRFFKDGNHVSIVSIEQPHMDLADQLPTDINIHKLEYPVNCAKNIKKLHDIIVDEKIDIVVNQWGLPSKTTKLCNSAIKGTHCKLVSVLHGSPYTSKVILQAQDKVQNSKNPILKIFYKCLLKCKEEVIKYNIRYNIAHNSKYILLSKGFIKPLINYANPSDTSNIVAIGNPITIPVNLNGFSLDNKKKQILYTGRMDFENKRVNRILDAWRTIANDYPEWSLVLVGDGPHKPTLLKMIEQHNIPRVYTEGFQVDPPVRFFKDASIYMLTSDLEGFGLVITESMSFGVVPIVYGSYEAIYDIVEDKKSGFITPMPYSNDETVKYLRILIENDSTRKNMAENAMARAKMFSLDSVVKQWYGLFNDVLK